MAAAAAGPPRRGPVPPARPPARGAAPAESSSHRHLQSAAPLARRSLPEIGVQPPEGWQAAVPLPTAAAGPAAGVAAGSGGPGGGWSRLERDLFLQSGGAYDPVAAAALRRVPHRAASAGGGGTGAGVQVPGRVSVVCPTMSSRQRYHEQLWGCFEAQTWPDKELVVVETYGDAPSKFLKRKAREDPRLVYFSIRVPSEAEDFNVGLKRSMTLHLASGEFVVNFDDDDLYAPGYAAAMVGEMQDRGAVALVLSAWFNYFVDTGVCGYSDPASQAPRSEEEAEELEAQVYGYGFGYVHRRREALAMPYPNVDFAEDLPFMLRLREELGDGAVALRKDVEGFCMHLVHYANTTVDPDYARTVAPDDVPDLEVAALPQFQRYLEDQAAVCSFLWPWSRLPARAWAERMGCL